MVAALRIAVVFGLGHAAQIAAEDSCHQRYLDHYSFPGCVVDARTDLPPIRPDAHFQVFAAKHLLEAGGKVSEMLSLEHSGLLLREVPAEGHGTNMSLVVEYAALRFGPGAVFPRIEPGGKLFWDNWATVAWYPEANYSEWLADASVVLMGTATGDAIERWFRWIPAWNAEHAGYQLWSVWDQPMVAGARRRLPDSICHTFTEDSLSALFKFGARLDQEKPFCRNYFTFIDVVALRTVDISDKRVAQDVYHFYSSLQDLFQKPFKNFTEFGRNVMSVINRFHGLHVYVHQRTSRGAETKYWLVNLTSPYIGLENNQRMILPWQNASRQDLHECDRRTLVAPRGDAQDNDQNIIVV